MLDIVLEGLVWGLILALSTGPVFITIIQTSIERGLYPAVAFAAGVLLSDVTYIVLINFGINRFIEQNSVSFVLGTGGSVLLVIFGMVGVLKKKRKDPPVQIETRVTLLPQASKGYLMNTLNPFVLFFWIGAAGTISIRTQASTAYLSVFYSALLSVVFLADILKAYTAHRIKKLITPSIILWMQRITGILLIGFGIRMLVYTIKDYGNFSF